MGIIKDFFTKSQEIKAEEKVPARCCVNGSDFEIHLGYEKGKLTMLKGVKVSKTYRQSKQNSVSKGGLKRIYLSNGLYTGRTYHCPVCGNKDIVRCGKCRRISCYDGNGHFTCPYCGHSGKVSGTMDSIEAYDSSGMKQDGIKYYPGDKGGMK